MAEEGCQSSCLNIHKTTSPLIASSGQGSAKAWLSKRHSRERPRKGEKSRRGSVSELSLCAGPCARQFTDSISFNHHNNPARKESRLPVSSEEMEAQSKTIFLS